MNIWTLEGKRVIATEKGSCAGSSIDQEKFRIFLEPGKIYTVERTYIQQYASYVRLVEIPDEFFNTVQFKNFDFQSKEEDMQHPEWVKWKVNGGFDFKNLDECFDAIREFLHINHRHIKYFKKINKEFNEIDNPLTNKNRSDFESILSFGKSELNSYIRLKQILTQLNTVKYSPSYKRLIKDLTAYSKNYMVFLEVDELIQITESLQHDIEKKIDIESNKSFIESTTVTNSPYFWSGRNYIDISKKYHSLKAFESIEMIYVNGGTYFSNNENKEISIGNFYISKQPITYHQWYEITGTDKKQKRLKHQSFKINDAEDYILFIEKLRKISQKKYRIPTTQEWEFASISNKPNNTMKKDEFEKLLHYRNSADKCFKINDLNIEAAENDRELCLGIQTEISNERNFKFSYINGYWNWDNGLFTLDIPQHIDLQSIYNCALRVVIPIEEKE